MTHRQARDSSRAARRGRPVFFSRGRWQPRLPCPTASLFLLILSPALGAQDLATCRAIAGDQQRLACYDALAARPVSPPAAGTVPIPGPADGTTPEELFGLEAATSAERLQRERGDAPVESLEQPVTAVTTDPFGKLRIRLANGQEWQQIDGDRFRVKPGEVVRIRRAALGSYLLSDIDGKRAIRVRRTTR